MDWFNAAVEIHWSKHSPGNSFKFSTLPRLLLTPSLESIQKMPAVERACHSIFKDIHSLLNPPRKQKITAGQFLAAHCSSCFIAPLFVTRPDCCMPIPPALYKIAHPGFIWPPLPPPDPMSDDRKKWTWFKGSVDPTVLSEWLFGRKFTAPWEELPYEVPENSPVNTYPATERDRLLARALEDNWSIPRSEPQSEPEEEQNWTFVRQKVPPHFAIELAKAIDYEPHDHRRGKKFLTNTIRPKILFAEPRDVRFIVGRQSGPQGVEGVITESPRKMTKMAFFSSPLRSAGGEHQAPPPEASQAVASTSYLAPPAADLSLVESHPGDTSSITEPQPPRFFNTLLDDFPDQPYLNIFTRRPSGPRPRNERGNIQVTIDCTIPAFIDPVEERGLAEYHARKWWMKRIRVDKHPDNGKAFIGHDGRIRVRRVLPRTPGPVVA